MFEYNGSPWEWRPLGMAAPGDGGPWEWRPLGVVALGSCGPWEWRPLAMAAGHRPAKQAFNLHPAYILLWDVEANITSHGPCMARLLNSARALFGPSGIFK